MKYVFVGGGNMGRALAAALIGKGVCDADEIHAVDPEVACREALSRMDCSVAAEADETLSEGDVVILAVKPQSAPEVMKQIKPLIKPEQVVVSIMAGVTVASVQKGLGLKSVVRVMPNTPAQVGLGMNVYYAAEEVSGGQLKAVKALLEASGEAQGVENEDAIDAATAISGSGPAYVFYMAEYWMKAAENRGFTTEQAELLVQQTLIGATALWKEMGVPVQTLRAQVTSKGGTTAAALEHMQAEKVGEHFEAGVQKAYARAKELAKG